jgi:hypothetical protein
MFCPKCGGSNPENGKFCRSCGQDLSPVSNALQPKLPRNGLSCKVDKENTLEGAMTKLFMGFAFILVAVILGFTGMGRTWWYWMFIPGFLMIGTGIARYMQLKRDDKAQFGAPQASVNAIGGAHVNVLPERKIEFANRPAASRYQTGDLVPPSVTESTTRHLEMDPEGETMTLPQK